MTSFSHTSFHFRVVLYAPEDFIDTTEDEKRKLKKKKKKLLRKKSGSGTTKIVIKQSAFHLQ